MTRAALVAVLLVAAPAVAIAAPIAVPAGWTRDAARSTADTEVYAAAVPGATLTVTRRAAAPGTDVFAAAHAAAVASLGAGAIEDDWQQHPDNQHRQREGLLHDHDAAAHTLGTIHIVAAADTTRAVAVTGACSATEATTYATITPCFRALDTLDTEIPEATRVWVPSDDPMPPPLRGDQPTIRPTLAPIILPRAAARPIDRRPMYLGALVVLFAVFSWWNRRRRIEQEDDLQALGRGRRRRAGRDDRLPEDHGDHDDH